MSWTPYVGDPNSSTTEGVSAVFVTNPSDVRAEWANNRPTRGPGMNAADRLKAALGGAVGWAHFTPDQQWFRDRLGNGRWGGRMSTAPGEVANRNVNMIRRYPDGTCDLINLEAAGSFVLDLGGRGARDTRIGRV